ncbi:hypothetical protein CDAR_457701 [Caerostris darwini]|uniref:Uncharacterized protein n=1 Tax=Caerostris darwini TaxID=1538125 RepID=A0AAV4N6D8_9ARAC|nr:hypothetical protein CDAR_457701 [Caerostris darwini]
MNKWEANLHLSVSTAFTRYTKKPATKWSDIKFIAITVFRNKASRWRCLHCAYDFPHKHSICLMVVFSIIKHGYLSLKSPSVGGWNVAYIPKLPMSNNQKDAFYSINRQPTLKRTSKSCNLIPFRVPFTQNSGSPSNYSNYFLDKFLPGNLTNERRARGWIHNIINTCICQLQLLPYVAQKLCRQREQNSFLMRWRTSPERDSVPEGGSGP